MYMGPQRLKRALALLMMELRGVVSFLTWVLGTDWVPQKSSEYP